MKNQIIRFASSAVRGALVGAVGAVLVEGATPSIIAIALKRAIKKAGYVPGAISCGPNGRPRNILARSPKGGEVVISVEDGGYTISTEQGDVVSAPSLARLTGALSSL